MMELMSAVEEFALALAGSPWLLVAVWALATIDGFFPPVPSESVVIAAAVLVTTGGGVNLWLLIAAAAAGALCGDLTAYWIGGKIPIHRLRVFQGRRGQASLSWASRALASRGTVLILSARFIPIGRVAVNMTAGAVYYPRPRFALVAAIAAVMWAGYSTVLGIGAGVFLHEHALLGVVVGVVGGVLLGFLVDAVLKRLHGRLGKRLSAGQDDALDVITAEVSNDEAAPAPPDASVAGDDRTTSAAAPAPDGGAADDRATPLRDPSEERPSTS